MSKPNKHLNLYKTAEVERAGLCPSCGSVLSVVTWTCVLGQFCPGERSSRSGNKINSGNKTATVKCSRCGAQVIGLGGKPCCAGLSIQQIKGRCLSTHRKIVRNLAAGRDALDGIEDYNGIGPRALSWLEAAGVVESGALTRLGRELFDAINAPQADN